MQVVMSMEEYEKLEQARITLCEIEELLFSRVHYYSEAYDPQEDYFVSNAIEYVKPLDRRTLIDLLKITGVSFLFSNIDLGDYMPKESEDDE